MTAKEEAEDSLMTVSFSFAAGSKDEA